jgi:hypothetical protein
MSKQKRRKMQKKLNLIRKNIIALCGITRELQQQDAAALEQIREIRHLLTVRLPPVTGPDIAGPQRGTPRRGGECDGFGGEERNEDHCP